MSPAEVSSGLHNSFPTSIPFLGSCWAVFLDIYSITCWVDTLGCSSFTIANDVLKIPVYNFVWMSWVNNYREVEWLGHIMGIYFTFYFLLIYYYYFSNLFLTALVSALGFLLLQPWGLGCTLLCSVLASNCCGFSCCRGQVLELGLGSCSCDTWA